MYWCKSVCEGGPPKACIGVNECVKGGVVVEYLALGSPHQAEPAEVWWAALRTRRWGGWRRSSWGGGGGRGGGRGGAAGAGWWRSWAPPPWCWSRGSCRCRRGRPAAPRTGRTPATRSRPRPGEGAPRWGWSARILEGEGGAGGRYCSVIGCSACRSARFLFSEHREGRSQHWAGPGGEIDTTFQHRVLELCSC